MKITQVDLYQVEIPLIPPIAKYFPKIYDITLCRIQTDEGIEGVGESDFYELTPQMRSLFEEKASSYIGKDPLKIDPFSEPSMFECAFLDIAGQVYGIPIHQFFGKKVRNRVTVSYWSCHMEPLETAAEAEVSVGLGFKNHKLKAQSHDIVKTVRMIREKVGGGYNICVDPNTEFNSLDVANRIAGELEPFGIVSVLEDPMFTNRLDWYRCLRENTNIPIALHIGRPHGPRPCLASDVIAAIKEECIDYFNFGGSSTEVKRAAAIAEEQGIPCWIQMGGVCLGVVAAYSVHVQCTIPNATLPCDELPFVRVADVTDGALVLDKGQFIVPGGPGLGVKLDQNTVEKYRVG